MTRNIYYFLTKESHGSRFNILPVIAEYLEFEVKHANKKPKQRRLGTFYDISKIPDGPDELLIRLELTESANVRKALHLFNTSVAIYYLTNYLIFFTDDEEDVCEVVKPFDTEKHDKAIFGVFRANTKPYFETTRYTLSNRSSLPPKVAEILGST